MKKLLLTLLVSSGLYGASVDDLTFTLLNWDTGKVAYAVSDCNTAASGSLEIPSTYNGLPVDTILTRAFENCSSLTSITIPNSVTNISWYAFLNCANLNSVNLPKELTVIPPFCFQNCSSLEEIIIPSSVTKIGEYAFDFCRSLTTITIPESVTIIEEAAFRNTDYLTNYIFNGDVPVYYSVVNYRDYLDGNTNYNAVISYYPDRNGWDDVVNRTASIRFFNNDRYIAFSSPQLDIPELYEPIRNETISVIATPISGHPSAYTYQWYFNGFPIPSFLNGTSPTYTIDGTSSSNGTWRVEVTNDVGTTSAEFEFRVFTDADSDGLSDYRESNTLGTNPNSADSDSDGLNDFVELNSHSTNPTLNDTDSDGLSDGDEVNSYSSDPLDNDSDDDGLADGVEVNTHSTDPNDTDSDDDQLSDADEINTHLTNPNLSDTDGDQLSDYSEVNSHLTDPNDSDSDNDGLSDGNEVNTHSTNPLTEDTSGDGFTDGFVVNQGADPLIDYSAFRTETVNQIKDARIGSTMIEVSDGKADITMTLEETSDLSDWSNATTSEKTIEVDAPSGTRFYRFKMTE